MYITNNKISDKKLEILEFLPQNIKKYMYNINLKDAYEIHISIDKPICIYYSDGRYCINRQGLLTRSITEAIRASREDISTILELITGASVYSVKDKICNGYITVDGGHRVGITGSAVIRNGRLSFIKDVSSLNFRLAGENIGISDSVIDYITDGKTVKNTLVISPPGAGKTTLLRDIARQLSQKGFRVSIVDERQEIAAMYNGKSSFDLGVACDVLTGVNKTDGMTMLLRSMSPQVIITDELGTVSDIEAVRKMINCGVSVIASVHGDDKSIDKYEQGDIKNHFEVLISLSKRNGAGTIEEVRLV